MKKGHSFAYAIMLHCLLFKYAIQVAVKTPGNGVLGEGSDAKIDIILNKSMLSITQDGINIRREDDRIH